jgi:hypothetical protein
MRHYPRGPVYVEHTDGSIGFLDDVTKLIQDVTKGATDEASKAVQDQASAALEKLLRSSEFGVVLQKVEDSAREAVIEEASKNALNLFILAVSGGAIGGMIFKGKVGAVAAGLLTVFAASRMVGAPTKTAEAASAKMSAKKAR